MDAVPPASLHLRPWGQGTASKSIRKPHTSSSQSGDPHTPSSESEESHPAFSQSGESHAPSSQSGYSHSPSSQSGDRHPPSSQSSDCPTCYLHNFAPTVFCSWNALLPSLLGPFCCFLKAGLSHVLLWEALCHPRQKGRALAILDSQSPATPHPAGGHLRHCLSPTYEAGPGARDPWLRAGGPIPYPFGTPASSWAQRCKTSVPIL